MNVTIHIPDWATHIVSDHTDMERDPHPVDASKVAKFSFELPDDAYFEYAFLDADGKMRADPQNETKADNPWYPNASAVLGPDYRADPYADIKEKLATGETRRHRLESAHLNQTRRLTFYTPKGFENASLPCVYVQDGTAYFRIAKLNEVLRRSSKTTSSFLRTSCLSSPSAEARNTALTPTTARLWSMNLFPLWRSG